MRYVHLEGLTQSALYSSRDIPVLFKNNCCGIEAKLSGLGMMELGFALEDMAATSQGHSARSGEHFVAGGGVRHQRADLHLSMIPQYPSVFAVAVPDHISPSQKVAEPSPTSSAH